MERRFFSLDNINSLAPVVAEVPGCWGWFEGESLHARNAMLFLTVSSTSQKGQTYFPTFL